MKKAHFVNDGHHQYVCAPHELRVDVVRLEVMWVVVPESSYYCSVGEHELLKEFFACL